MARLPENIKKLPVNQLILVGTHDSAAYCFDLENTPVFDDSWVLNGIRCLAKLECFKALATEFVTNGGRTQENSIRHQLEQGIRALDLRILYHAEQKKFYFSHGFVTVDLETGLKDIAAFMFQHPGEILVIQMKNDWDHKFTTRPNCADALHLVRFYLGQWLIPRTLGSSLDPSFTLESLVAKDTRIFFAFGWWEACKENLDVWSWDLFEEFWPNCRSATQSIRSITEYLPKLAKISPHAFNLVFFTVTPCFASLFVEKCTFCVKDWARAMTGCTDEFLRRNISQLGGLNIISLDWPDPKLVEKIIALNSVPPLERRWP